MGLHANQIKGEETYGNRWSPELKPFIERILDQHVNPANPDQKIYYDDLKVIDITMIGYNFDRNLIKVQATTKFTTRQSLTEVNSGIDHNGRQKYDTIITIDMRTGLDKVQIIYDSDTQNAHANLSIKIQIQICNKAIKMHSIKSSRSTE